MKYQDDISIRNIIVAKFQGPTFRKRAITEKNIIWATTRENVPSDNFFDIKGTSLI